MTSYLNKTYLKAFLFSIVKLNQLLLKSYEKIKLFVLLMLSITKRKNKLLYMIIKLLVLDLNLNLNNKVKKGARH